MREVVFREAFETSTAQRRRMLHKMVVRSMRYTKGGVSAEYAYSTEMRKLQELNAAITELLEDEERAGEAAREQQELQRRSGG